MENLRINSWERPWVNYVLVKTSRSQPCAPHNKPIKPIARGRHARCLRNGHAGSPSICPSRPNALAVLSAYRCDIRTKKYMKTRIKYFFIYLVVSGVLFALASFIDYALDMRMMNIGVKDTFLASLGIGTFLGGLFGLTLKISPLKFPWEYLN